MKLKYLIVGGCVVVLLVILSLGFSNSYSKAIPDVEREASGVRPVKIPDSMTFAGEVVPLQYFDVREGLDRELNVNIFYQSQTLFYIKRSTRYFPIIEPILVKYGVPVDFKYLAVAESGLAQAVSPAKAAGIWQLLEPTAKEYGLEINDEVDERYNIEKSTEVACRFLVEAYNRFGSWAMAAAAYNMGRQALINTIDRQQESYYYNLYLNDETARYMYRLAAVKLIIEQPKQYGFFINDKDKYPSWQYNEVKVDTPITSIAAFAKAMNTNYKMLKTFNPWLRNGQLTNKQNKTYTLKIPSSRYRETAYYDAIDTIVTINP